MVQGIGDPTTQLCGDYSKPLKGFQSLLNNQYNGKFKVRVFFFVAQFDRMIHHRIEIR